MTVVKLHPTLLLSMLKKYMVIIKLTKMKVIMVNPKFVLLFFPKFVLLVKYTDVVIVIRPNQTSLFLITMDNFVSV